MRTVFSYCAIFLLVGIVTPSVLNDESISNHELGITNQADQTTTSSVGRHNSPLTTDNSPKTSDGNPSRFTPHASPKAPAGVSQLVQFKEATTVETVATTLGTQDIRPVDATTYEVTNPAIKPETITTVTHVEDSAVFTTLLRPSDPSFGNQVGLTNVSATDAWDYETGSPTVRIAVIDTGVNGLHEDLYGRVIEGYDFVADHPIGRNVDSDDHGHGTAVASVAAAQGNNSVGMAGLTWNADVMPIKALDSNGFGTTREVVLGIRYAIERHANIIVMSIGSSSPSALLEQAINDAWAAGILVVAAAGNDGAVGSTLLYPAQYEHTLSVGATNGNDGRASFSNVGPALDVMAPGVGVTVALDGGGYGTSSGTSLAAPFVAGTAALLKSRHPGLNPDQLLAAIRGTADKVAGLGGAEHTNQFGYGRLNTAAALRSVTGDDAATLVSKTENVPSLGSTQSVQIQYVYRNTGTSVWKRSGPHNTQLITASPTARISPFLREDLVTRKPSGWVAPTSVSLVEDEVQPGGTGTFRFWVSVPVGLAAGTYDESMQVETRDVGVVPNTAAAVRIPVLAELDRYHARYVGQTPNPTLTSNGSAKFQVFYRNEGNATWTKAIVQLGTNQDKDRVSQFKREDTTGGSPSGWISPTRVSLDQDVVAPGQIGSFTFYLADTPSINSGTYREHFQPVAEGIGWMEDIGLFWDLTVQ